VLAQPAVALVQPAVVLAQPAAVLVQTVPPAVPVPDLPNP